MGMRIQTNVQSLNAQKNLSSVTKSNEDSMEKLSSGFRINKASDDAAGLAISEKMRADIRGLNMARRNANDGISVIQTAEGGMNEIGNILSRLRELAVQGSSDTIGDKERGFIHKEFNSLKDEVDRITNSTEYDGKTLLAGKQNVSSDTSAAGSVDVQVGKNWNASVDGAGAKGAFAGNPVNVIRLGFDKIDTSTGKSGLNLGRSTDESMDSTGVYLAGEGAEKSKQRAQMSIAKLDDAITKVSSFRADLGASQSRLNSTISNLSTASENYSAANSRIRDTDFAEETAKMAQSGILKQAGTAMLSQANQTPSAVLSLLR